MPANFSKENNQLSPNSSIMEILHEINLARFWRLFTVHKRVFFLAWVGAAALALIVGFSQPRTYQSQIQLAPETGNSNLGGLSSMGNMLGLKLGDMGGGDAISPTLYPDVVSSPNFLLDLLTVKVTTKKGDVKNVDYKTYLTKHSKASWWDALMLKVKSLFPKKEKEPSMLKSGIGRGPIMLSRDDEGLLKAVGGAVSCTVDKKTDVITVKVIDQDPLVAATMADSVSSRLQTFITNYRTQKARGEVAHLQQLYDKAIKDYKKAQDVYAAYSDAHADVVLNAYKVKMEEMENDIQLKYNVYTQLAVQLKTAQSKVLERTPVYTVLQEAMVPNRHIAPKKMKIVLMYLILATFFTMVVLYYRDRKKEQAQSAETPVESEELVGSEESVSPDALPSTPSNPE